MAAPIETADADTTSTDTTDAGAGETGTFDKIARGRETDDSAIRVLRRGLAASPELRKGLPMTALMGLSATVGFVVLPILIERMINDGFTPDGAIRRQFLVVMSLVGLGVLVGAAGVGWLTRRRLTYRAESAIAQLRADAFATVHRLSVADHNETRRGVLVSRVTSDTETLARFAQWGLLSWSINPVLIAGFFAVVTFYYSWIIALVWVACFAPALPILWVLQRRQLRALDEQRSHIGDMYGLYAEAVSGAGPVRVYGLQRWLGSALATKANAVYRTSLRAAAYFASTYAAGEIASAAAMAATLVVGLGWRQTVGLDEGELVAVLIMTTMLQRPIGELGETLDQTQSAIAGWRKILDLLDYDIDVKEPDPGATVAAGPLAVRANKVMFHYRAGEPVLHDVTVTIPAGANVAVVGETGSGKTTFAKLLVRLADPVEGTIEVADIPAGRSQPAAGRGEASVEGADRPGGGWIAVSDLSPASRRAAIRMVPQDGFLFDGTIAENVKRGNPGAADAQVEQAFSSLGLGWWLQKLDGGVHFAVGQRGENLSVGERQLVALARAALASPGVLVLDEATSAVDPETDQALTGALQRLATGRTMVTIAHRLSTAEQADLVLVFDRGQLIEHGTHQQLIDQGGTYARMHRAWVGGTRQV